MGTKKERNPTLQNLSLAKNCLQRQWIMFWYVLSYTVKKVMLIETQLSNQDENEDEERKESDSTGLVQNVDVPSNSTPTQAEEPVYTLV